MSQSSEYVLRRYTGDDGVLPIDSTAGATTLADVIALLPNTKKIVKIKALTDTTFTALSEDGSSALTKFFSLTTGNVLPAGGVLVSKINGFDSLTISAGKAEIYVTSL